MTLLLLLTALWARPDAAPVGQAEVEAALRLESEFGATRAASCRVDPAAEQAARIPGRFVVGYRTGGEEAAVSWVESVGGKVVKLPPGAGFLVAEFPEQTDVESLLVQARHADAIRYVEPDYRVDTQFVPNDPEFLRRQWGKWVMYSDLAWDITTGSQSVTVAVVDNGVEYYHPDLAANFDPASPGRDVLMNDNDPRPDNPGIYGAFHGTHVSGIIGAVTNNATGVAGWAQVRLKAVRAMTDSGSGDLSDVATGVRWAVDHGANIVNMSLGGPSPGTALTAACRYADSAGVLLIAASGNAGHRPIDYPAALSQCAAVGATNGFSTLADFSNFGSSQELVAPGVEIFSTHVGGTYSLQQGTSMACPQVTGVAALVMSANPGLSARKVRSVLSASAIDMGVLGYDEYYGNGLVNAERALDLAATMAGQAGTALRTLPVRAATAVDGELRLPGWVQRVEVYDTGGRLAGRWGAAATGPLRLRPGAWFAILVGPGRSERLKVLVP